MRHRWIRRIARILSAIGLVGALAACAPPAEPPDTITLAMWATLPAEANAMDRAIAAFKTATGITVKKVVITDKYMDVIRSRFAARITPDVMYLDSAEAPFLIKSDVLLPLDAALQDPADFPSQFLDAFRGDDHHLYGIPKDYSTLALYVNTDLLAAAGWRIADIPRDEDGLMAFALKLQKRLPRGVGAMLFEADLARHLSAIEAFGQPITDREGNATLTGVPGVEAYLQAYVDGRRAGALLSPKDDLGADSPGAAFGAGKAVMMIEGPWALASLHQDFPAVKFVTLPTPTVNGKPQTMAFVVGYSIPKYARNPAGGIRFAQYMTSAGAADWSRYAGLLPVRRSVQARVAATQDPLLAAHIAGVPYATVWSRGTSLPAIESNFSNQFLAALNGSITVHQALARAQAAANREIERER
ncbi:MAG: extracellular solute-binding protein [Burkholderiales bacterium]|nr:extracellular solute-binding protein [Burkholderiales bacterium]